MKVTDICRKLRTALVAGGLLVPAAAQAADLNMNLVVNGDFENVDLNVTSYYNAPKILDWGGPLDGFCYSFDYSGNFVPDFSNGGPLAGGGSWYFTPGNSLIHSIDEALTQDVDVSTGDTAAAIANGSATYDLSAFFSTYDGQADRGFVRVDFLGSGGANLGFAQVNSPVSPALANWTQFSNSGDVPAGTLTVRVRNWGEVFTGSTGSADGYTDNIVFSIDGMAGISGDYNNDGVVDTADYVTFRKNEGLISTLPNDPNVGTTVDIDQFNTWTTHFGEGSAGSGGTAVPEASSLMLVGLGLGSLTIGSRKRSVRG